MCDLMDPPTHTHTHTHTQQYLIDPSSPTGRTSLCVLGASAGGRVPTPSVRGYLHTVLHGQGTGQYHTSALRKCLSQMVQLIGY